jgi:hypothetical protein
MASNSRYVPDGGRGNRKGLPFVFPEGQLRDSSEKHNLLHFEMKVKVRHFGF